MSSRNLALLAAGVLIVGAILYRVQSTKPPALAPVSVAVVTGGSGPYWQLVASGARAAGKAHDVAVEVSLPEADENIEQQTRLLEKIDADKVDGVAVSLLDVPAQAELIDKLAAKADVVTFDSDAPGSKRLSYIGTINVQAGREAAELVHEAIPSGGKIALVFANLTKDNMLGRKEGFEAELKKLAAEKEASGSPAAYEVIETIVDDGDVKKCRELVDKAIADHDDLACLVGMNAQHGAILLEALKSADKLGKVSVVAFDEQKETLDGIESGAIYGAVVQDPYRYGFDAVKVLAAYARGEESVRPLKGSFSTFGVAPITVKKESLAEFRAELAKRLDGEGTK